MTWFESYDILWDYHYLITRYGNLEMRKYLGRDEESPLMIIHENPRTLFGNKREPTVCALPLNWILA